MSIQRLRAALVPPSFVDTKALDTALLEDVAYRLRWITAVIGVTLGVSVALQAALGAAGLNLVPWDLAVVGPRVLGAICSLIFYLTLRAGRLPARRVVQISPAYEILIACCLVSFELALHIRLEAAVLSSFLPAHIFSFRAFVPMGLRKATLATLGSVLTLPLCAGLLSLGGLPVVWKEIVVLTVVVSMISAGAVVLSVVLRRIQGELTQAREMGSYELVGELGRGGMGVVYRARHRMLKRDAAIKVIQPEGMGPDIAGALARFEREALTTAALRSPHTIEVYDFGPTDDGAFFYVMELLDGFDLEALVRAHGALPPERAIHLLLQACSSLAEAHAVGLVHRDLKPANLFCCQLGPERDVLKVMDFGLVTDPTSQARATHGEMPEQLSNILQPTGTSSLTVAGTVCGTPGFMAPEAIRGEVSDARSDVYAMGCVAYWLLTGRRTHRAKTPWLLFIAHLEQPPAPLEGVPDDLAAVVSACLAKDPAQRPADGAELARRLRACQHAGRWTTEQAEAWWAEHRKQRAPAADSEPPAATTIATTMSFAPPSS